MTAVLLGVAVLLGACSSDEAVKPGVVGFVEGFLGGVAADEPNAAIIGRNILSAGGSAVDAAAAVYFALAVTMPSTASLGGGGVCLVHDSKTATTEALDFLARAPRIVPPGATRPSAIPGNARGFFALHAKYGTMRWSQILGPAEKLARFGFQISRAFARDLASVEQALMAEPGSRRVFARGNEAAIVKEGDFLVQLDLAATLARLRNQGPGEFYVGNLGRTLVKAVTAAGGSLSREDLRTYAPLWQDTIQVRRDEITAHFVPSPAAAGGVAAEMFAMLTEGNRYQNASADEKPHMLAEVALRAFADRGRWLGEDGGSRVATGQLTATARMEALMESYVSDRHVAAGSLNPAPVERVENPSATSFVVVDRLGGAVACALTMNNLFGTGRIADGTGVVIAARPGQGGRGPTSLGPMMVIKHNVNEFYFTAAASGGVTAPTAMMNVAAASILDQTTLAYAIKASRLHHGGMPDLVFHEQDLPESAVQSLARRGHRIGATESLGRVNAIFCPEGLPPNPNSCAIRTDPRGFGLATSADR